MSTRTDKGGKSGDNALNKIIPSHYILRDIVDRVLQEKPIFMAEDGLLHSFFEPNLIYRVSEGQVFSIGRNVIQVFSGGPTPLIQKDK